MGLVLLVYLDLAVREALDRNAVKSRRDLLNCVYIGTVRRIRPQTMTVSAALIGLTPMLWMKGAGGGIMRHLATPMIGGLASSFFLELLVLPALYYMVMGIALRKHMTASTALPPQEATGEGAKP
jgi:Cu(I)/Ag(I) efflux system membrane protein CusA/SilA